MDRACTVSDANRLLFGFYFTKRIKCPQQIYSFRIFYFYCFRPKCPQKNKKGNANAKRGGAKNSGGGSSASASKANDAGDVGAASTDEDKEAVSVSKDGDEVRAGG